MMLLIRSKRLLLQQHPNLPVAGYGDLMFHAFGTCGQAAVDVLLTLSTITIGISYCTFIAQNIASIASALQLDSQATTASLFDHVLQQAREGLQHAQYTGYGTAMSVPLESSNIDDSGAFLGSWIWTSSVLYAWILFPLEVALAAIPSLTYLAPLSLLAGVANYTALAAVAVAEILEIQKASGFPSLQLTAFRNTVSLPSAFGVGIYIFQMTGMMIPLELAMEEPSKLGTVLGWAVTVAALIYAGFAVLGYMAFGDDVEQIITLNLQEGIVLPIIVKGAICSSLLIALPVQLHAIWEVVERRFSQRRISLWSRALVVFVICLLATTVKQIAVFLSLAGSSISCLLGLILPAALHLTLTRESRPPPPFVSRAADYVLIAFGLVMDAFGTAVSIMDLVM